MYITVVTTALVIFVFMELGHLVCLLVPQNPENFGSIDHPETHFGRLRRFIYEPFNLAS